MKRYGNLKQLVLSKDNLILAEKRARKGKKNTYGVQRYDNDDSLTLDLIRQKLEDCSYRTSKYHIFKIYEPKEREIYQLPYYPDRIVHHALMNVLEPIFVSWFIEGTYSCIKNRGIHKAQRDIERDLRKYSGQIKYCLKLDIRKFYPSISRDILFKTLQNKFKDQWLLTILKEIIYSTDSGVPIGNYLSQFFANVYLTKFDHWVKEQLGVKCYYRYCDDIVVFYDNKKDLYKLYRQMNQRLSFLKLKVKPPRIFLIQYGVDFVGYVFRSTYTLLRKSIKIKYKRQIRRYKELPALLFRQKIASYYGWLAHCDGKHLLNLTIPTIYKRFKKQYIKHDGSRILKR